MSRGVIWTDTEGCISNIPVDYKYADDSKLWNVHYCIVKESGASVTMFIETGTSTAQGELGVYVDGSATVTLHELPADGSSYASIPSGDATALTVYNVNRQSAPTDNVTAIRIGTDATWVHAVDSTELDEQLCNTYYPYRSGNSKANWIMHSSATYAVSITSKAASNYICIVFTWNESAV